MNVNAKADAIEAEIARYVAEEVTPYLQTLLDRAQAKMPRHALRFLQGMGVEYFDIANDSSSKLDDAIIAAATMQYRGRTYRYAERFPELVEFRKIVNVVEERLNSYIGDLTPTNMGDNRANARAS